jgi:hypothetical protein
MADLLKMRSASETMIQQAEADHARYQAIQKTYPPLPASPDNLRAVVGRFEDLEKRSAPLEPLYLAVSRALGEVPRVDIERLQWQVSANPDEGLQASADPRKPPAGSGQGAAQSGTEDGGMNGDDRLEADLRVGAEDEALVAHAGHLLEDLHGDSLSRSGRPRPDKEAGVYRSA